jgi:putative endonuclease
MTYYIYILQCADGSYYTGLTGDLKRRVREHIHGKHHRAYTYSRRPVKLVWSEQVAGSEAAKLREKQVKALKRPQKEALIATYNNTNEVETEG